MIIQGVNILSTVIGVRVPKWLKEELERLGINYAKEIREYLERRVREEKLKRVLREIAEIRRRIGRVEGNLAAEFIREDREGR